MKAPRTLVRQYVLVLAMFVAALSAGAFFITSAVARQGLEDLFRQRFAQAGRVLDEYAHGRDLTTVAELQGVLGSPRFLAAIETSDPATVELAVPTHAALAAADCVRITPYGGGEPLYETEGEAWRELLRAPDGDGDAFERRYVVGNGTVYEVASAGLRANNGAPLGRLDVARDVGPELVDDLRRLTGLEAILSLDGTVVGVAAGIDDAPEWLPALARMPMPPDEDVAPRVVAGHELLVRRIDDATTGVTVLFAGSVHDAIAPIMQRARMLLLLLAVAGGVASTWAVAAFTERRIGRTVQKLVAHANRISDGDLQFEIPNESADELGYLAGKLERMRAELLRSRDAVESAHQSRVKGERMAAVGAMATGIIHDLKSPMAVVQGTADLIAARDPDNPKLAKQCDVIHKQIDRMVALTRDVIEFARGDSVLEPETVDVPAYLAEIRGLHEEGFRQAGVQFVVEAPEIAGALLDPGRMQRVIDNLLTNAREVSRVGDTVRLRWIADRDGARIEVRDEGPGIAPEIAKTLFEPFVTAGKKGGSGLGLAISRKIVEDHGATLTVESAPGKGAAFVVTLPRKLLVQARAEEGVVS